MDGDKHVASSPQVAGMVSSNPVDMSTVMSVHVGTERLKPWEWNQVDTQVQVQFVDGVYEGTVVKAHHDGSFDVEFPTDRATPFTVMPHTHQHERVEGNTCTCTCSAIVAELATAAAAPPRDALAGR